MARGKSVEGETLIDPGRTPIDDKFALAAIEQFKAQVGDRFEELFPELVKKHKALKAKVLKGSITTTNQEM